MVNIFVKALDHGGKGRSAPKFGSVPHDVPLVELIEGRFRSEGLPSLKNARASGNRTCSACSRRALLLKRAQPNQTDLLFLELVEAETLRSSGSVIEAEQLDRSARERLKAIAGAALPRMLVLVF